MYKFRFPGRSSGSSGSVDTSGLLALAIVLPGLALSACSNSDSANTGRAFMDVTSSALSPVPPSLEDSFVAAADYDSNGYPDILLIGRDGGDRHTVLYQNQTDGTFSEVASSAFSPVPPSLADGSVIFFDYNSDGHPDIVMTGSDGSDQHTLLYHNEGDGTFSDVTSTAFPPGTPNLEDSSIAVADYNSNGDFDILLTGWDGTDRHTLLYQNQGDGTFSDVTSTALPAAAPDLANGSVVFFDYNSDGFPAILLTGSDGTDRHTLLYHNQANGTFSDLTLVAFSPVPPNLDDASVAIADYNASGHPDILLTGSDGTNRHTLLYQNQGDGTFSDVAASAFPVAPPNLSEGSVIFVDYNSDGHLDIVMTGWDGNDRHTLLYENQGDGTFIDVTLSAFSPVPPNLAGSSVISVDYNLNGHPDIVLTGWDGADGNTLLYRNQTGE